MKNQIISKLIQAQDQLQIHIPEPVFNYISELQQAEVKFGNEEWAFPAVYHAIDNSDDNFMITLSNDFQEHWGIKAFLFADNGIGDYLLLLPDEIQTGFRNEIFVLLHETAEVKVFATSLSDLLENGPEDYFWNDEYFIKLDDDGNVVQGSPEFAGTQNEKEDNDEDASDIETDDENDALRSRLDDLIDDQETGKASEIIQGLSNLMNSEDLSNKVWAINKLSDLYLRGFGPIPKDLEKALKFNQVAIDLNSHKAYSNRAACYFAGIGMERDLHKALEFAMKANELSKSNFFADVFAEKDGGGMYDGLVRMIKKEIRNGKK